MISIHALREEGDHRREVCQGGISIFLSTPSARRATRPACLPQPLPRNFYPRPPRGGRHGRGAQERPPDRISIHALREEGDILRGIGQWRNSGFLSTPSARRATVLLQRARTETPISIHALREEGDAVGARCPAALQHFYPRPPRGGRQQKQRQKLYFQTNYTTFCTNLEEP